MTHEKNQGIRRALKLAKLTRTSVNVALNIHGESKKIEGIIRKVGKDEFLIRLDDGGRKSVDISKVEYVEYS